VDRNIFQNCNCIFKYLSVIFELGVHHRQTSLEVVGRNASKLSSPHFRQQSCKVMGQIYVAFCKMENINTLKILR
jgi:hypothetical protein